ncbi:HlyD family type I secretion periplasmic adaptor subunit [Paucibacter sp. B2R-40]|uniref:HlyD family type I secretion periplasmic adaptor subunit n=1 Tax=Paucibacter sp. B2R-40 TaxID=2893554 RepID=UPI0021E3DBE5|nr:HlyD family type I secretion periplasmic adaptor subunit [Paucibacter sp. B2R-40]MCV2355707.1 HlyD family type I secretion periplasmic adaptor subunit [Paucibacter sp. B2R-40]
MTAILNPPPAAATNQVLVLDLLAAHFDASLGLQRRLRLPRALIYGVAFSLLALLLWMSRAEIDRVVHTQGRVIPSTKQQLVQHLEGGIVSKVFVREGDAVSAGQNLIAVSDLQASSSRGEKRARLEGLTARVARLQAEAGGANRFAAAGLPTDSPELRNESASFAARQAKLAQTLRVIEEQLTQKRQEAREQEVRRKGLSAELEVARQQLALVSNMLAKNAASQLEVLDARARVERLATQIREAEMAVPRLEAAAQELQARLAEVQAQFRSEARTALAEAQIDLQRLQQELGADDDRVRRTVLTASVSGTVNKILSNTVGGVVRPGDTLMELTPADAALAIESRVAPAERGSLAVGQKAVVKVAAFDYTSYGTLSGKINEISADSLVDERGERYFRIGIVVDPDSVKQFGQPVTPGMTVTADAVTGQRTVLQYLLSPIRGLAATALRDRK